MSESHSFVAGAAFGDVGVSLFVAGAIFGDVGMSLFVAETVENILIYTFLFKEPLDYLITFIILRYLIFRWSASGMFSREPVI